MLKNVELVIIGGGPAGMSAAVSAYNNGIKDILVLDREPRLGGILQQCIHNGFGLHRFKEELTGPEYSWKYEQLVAERNIPVMLNTMVIDVTSEKIITAMNEENGVFQIKANAVIMAMGCRERSKGALNIAGMRPAGIYTAGAAQKFVNIKGYMPGKRVVILGSGDIGLIMARRMTLEGAKVLAVCELMPYSGGLTRNIVQCLNDFDIPLKLSHTVIDIKGKERVEGVTIAQVDENRKPMLETAEYIECDTLLLSVGLIPENELSKAANVPLDRVTGGAIVDQSRQTMQSGIFACGNVLHVHDLADYASEEAEIAGKGAAEYIKCGGTSRDVNITLKPISGVRYTVPHHITSRDADVKVYFRVADVYKGVAIQVKDGDDMLYNRKKQRVAPGEMECITVTSDMLKNAKSDTITIGLDLNR